MRILRQAVFITALCLVLASFSYAHSVARTIADVSLHHAGVSGVQFTDYCLSVVSPGAPHSVPDGGKTAIFLGGALAALAVLRRFVKR
jgi:hypothetical protein